MASAFFQSPLDFETSQHLNQTLSSKSHPVGQCQLWTGPVDKKGYGVHCVKFQGRFVRVQVHRLSYYLHGTPQRLSRSHHVSHLCHNPSCIKFSHLSYEPPKINNSRQICKKDGECTGHRGYKKCLLQMVIMWRVFSLQCPVHVLLVTVVLFLTKRNQWLSP